MASINVEKLDDNVVHDLTSRAARNNRSLEGEVRHILEDVVREDMTERWRAFLERTEALRRKTQGRILEPSDSLIRKDRDHRVR